MGNLELRQVPEIVNKKVEERISQIESRLIETIETEKELLEFEILNSLLVEPQMEIHKRIKDERIKAWQQALEKAKGNKERAIEIFDELYPK